MDITKLHPNILEQKISFPAKAGDVLFFNSLITHGTSNNSSSSPQLRCYPNLAPLNLLPNPPEEVLDTYLNGTHPKKYAHFFTGNNYKETIAHAQSTRRHFHFPLGQIGKAIVGATPWTSNFVVQELTILFSGNVTEQNKLINTWVDNFTADWENIVKHQIVNYP